MRIRCIAILGMLTCAAGTLAADGFSEYDQPLLAGKGVFNSDQGGDDEGVLPETTDDTSGKSEKDVYPEVDSKQSKTGKDIGPPEDTKPMSPKPNY